MPEECRQRTFVAPSGAKEMPLVRHGESRVATDERSSPLLNGHGDPKLQSLGRELADAVGLARHEEGGFHMLMYELFSRSLLPHRHREG